MCELITVHIPGLCSGDLAPWYESHDTQEEAKACYGYIKVGTIELWVCGKPEWNDVDKVAVNEFKRRFMCVVSVGRWGPKSAGWVAAYNHTA